MPRTAPNLTDAGGDGGLLRRGLVKAAEAAILPTVRRLIDESVGRIAVRDATAAAPTQAVGIRRALMFDPAAGHIYDDPDNGQVVIPLSAGTAGGLVKLAEVGPLTSPGATDDAFGTLPFGEPVRLPASGSLPATSRHLLLIGLARCRRGISVLPRACNVWLSFNDDYAVPGFQPTDYDWGWHQIDYYATHGPQGADLDWGIQLGYAPGDGAPSGYAASFHVTIPYYANTHFWKHAIGTSAWRDDSDVSGVRNTLIQAAGNWQQTAAITSLTLTGSYSFDVGTVWTLYGLP